MRSARGVPPKTAHSVSDAEDLREGFVDLGVDNPTALRAKQAFIDALDQDVISITLVMTELPLRSRTDDDQVHINIGRLLNREGNRVGPDRELVSQGGELRLHLRICHRFHQIRRDEAG